MEITLEKINDVYMHVDCDMGIAQDIQEHFTYKADGYRFHPKFKAKLWNGDIKLFSAYNRKLYVGLLNELIDFAKINKVQLNIDPLLSNKTSITPKDVVEFMTDLNLTAHGKPVIPRDYQYYAVYHSIYHKRATIVSPTSSGKSLNIYCTLRWYTEKYKKKVLVIVPTVMLVTQMYSDFDDYATLTDWNAEDNVHKIVAGVDKDADKQIYVSTWQSLTKQSTEWFSQFGMIYCDEVHGATAKSIKGIMEKTVKCEYKIGTTGTTGSKKVNDLLIQGVFGKIKKTISTKTLMERKQIAMLKIICVSLLYPEIDRKECRNKDYQGEVDFLVKHTARNNMIIDSLKDMNGNKLVLVNKVAHVKTLHERAVKLYPNMKIFIIHGKVDKDEREDIRQYVDANNNCIIFATYGTMSTGVSIRNLEHIIFASGSKSEIRVLQSLGRVLRLSERKSTATLWDIVDDLSIKKKKNFLLKHFIERFKIYTKEGFDIEMVKVKL